MAYGVEAMIPVEVEVPSFRHVNFDEELNNQALAAEIDILEEKRDAARIRMMAQKQRMARYYNSKTKKREFKIGDTVLRQVFLHTQEAGAGKLGATWERPYQIKDIVRPGTYRLADLAGIELMQPWNAEHLKKYYN